MKSYSTISGRKIRVAVVGCGRISKNHFDSIEKHQKDMVLVSICDSKKPILDEHKLKYQVNASFE